MDWWMDRQTDRQIEICKLPIHRWHPRDWGSYWGWWHMIFPSLRMRSMFVRSDRLDPAGPNLGGFWTDGARTHQSLLVSFHACFDRAMRFWPLHIIHSSRINFGWCVHWVSTSPAMNWGPTWSSLRCATYGPRVGHWDGSQGSWSQKNFEIFEPLELVKMVVETSEMYQVGG